MWESQKKSWEDAFLKQNGYTQTNKKKSNNNQKRNATDWAEGNKCLSFSKVVFNKKKITPASPLWDCIYHVKY